MKIPIVLYHMLFRDDWNRERYAVSEGQFESQMKYLSEQGFQSVLVDDLASGNLRHIEKGIAITFDDGNLSDYCIALPILKKYHFVATFFITAAWVGHKNRLDWMHLKEMALEGMSIQSHGLTHAFLSDLYPNRLRIELNEPRRMLERKLGTPVRFCSVPGGCYSKEVLSIAKEAGYKGVVTSAPGLNGVMSNRVEFSLFKRFNITHETSFKEFVALTNCHILYLSTCRMGYFVKVAARKVLGNKRYYEFWSKFSKYLR